MNKTKIPMGNALVLILAAAAMIIAASFGVNAIFTGRMKAFEKATPAAALAAYMEKVENQDYTELYEQFKQRTGSLSSEQDFITAMNDLYEGINFDDIKFIKDDRTSEEQTGTYTVSSEGLKVSTLNLSRENDQWIVETKMDTAGDLSVIIEAPAGVEVKLNDVVLSDEYVIDKEADSALYDRFITNAPVPVVVRYQVDNLMSAPEITSEGHTVVRDAFDGRFYIGDQPTAEEQKEAEKIILAIAEAASRYATADGSLRTLASYFVGGSEFISKINTMDTRWYTVHNGVSFDNGEVFDLIRLNEEEMLGKVTFDYTVYSQRYGDRVYHVGYQLILSETNGTWKALDLTVNNDLHPANQK